MVGLSPTVTAGMRPLVEDYPGAGGIGQILGGGSNRWLTVDGHILNRRLQIDGSDVEALEYVHDERVLLGQQTDEQMLRPHVVVVPPLRLFARLDQRPANSVGEIVPAQKTLLATS